MQQKKRSYSDELKSKSVKMMNEQGISQEQAGRLLSILEGMIASWALRQRIGARYFKRLWV